MKTLLVVLLLLIVGTGTASAECAWVLWSNNIVDDAQGSHRGGYESLAAFPTHSDCMKAAERRAAFHADLQSQSPEVLQAKADRGSDGTWSVAVFLKSGKIISSILPCLPDTVDPRGPKK